MSRISRVAPSPQFCCANDHRGRRAPTAERALPLPGFRDRQLLLNGETAGAESTPDQRDRADGLDMYCDMSDLGPGEDRLSWVDNPLSLCHVSTTRTKYYHVLPLRNTTYYHKDVPHPSRDDLISPGHSHSRCARPLRARRWHGHRARLKPCGNLCELWRPQAVRRAQQAGRAR